MELNAGAYPEENQPLLVRARGKEIIPCIIRILTQFQVSFGVLHDLDSPRTKEGTKKNSAWSANQRIMDAIKLARDAGLRVVHRVSVPECERQHGLPKGSGKKPFKIWKKIGDTPGIMASIRNVLDDLMSSDAVQEPCDGNYPAWIKLKTSTWAATYAVGDVAFNFDDATDAALQEAVFEE